MTTEEFKRNKRKVFKRIKSEEELDESLEKSIIEAYGSRGKRAIEVVKSGRVRRDKKRWFVQGREKEYEIVESHCSCYDYVLNIATGKADVDMCYHALAKNIQELLDMQ
ncbi:hypothetical protein AKJ57_00735 [candidate division MSBL1 archaeon SCGC-AAA259A05]|uniref:SWIM-type domain-containing protein n=1 Tax=candidate division MSBL1 archaeon SCGC-AAA259A05 TaxID=1698259 RepID=A0A133UBN9_9EURY|nr:hypothetical protein AKJ57_00735 [candidate division MSBL1 archaeon SCGC-AAA259A05]